MDGDEKALIIAAAVLGLILVTMLIFGALYKSFLSQYAQAYDSSYRRPSFDKSPVRSPRSSTDSAADKKYSAGPVHIKLSNQPTSEGGGYARPNSLGSSPNKPLNQTNNEVPTIMESNVDNVFAENPNDQMEFGNTTLEGQTTWTNNPASGNEFFSADEQARIWQELRDAEEKAGNDEPSASDKAKEAALKAQVEGEYVVPVPDDPPKVVTPPPPPPPPPVEEDDQSNTSAFDPSTSFDTNPVIPSNKPVQEPESVPTSPTINHGPGYIDPSGLESASVSYLDPTNSSMTMTMGGDIAQAEMGVNADNEWWK